MAVTFSDSSCVNGAARGPSLVPRQNEKRQQVATLFPLTPFVVVLPRSKDKIFVDAQNPNGAVRDLLPDFLSAGEMFHPFRELEGRFYVDIARQHGGTYKAERKITAVFWDFAFQPIEGKPVSWRLRSGSPDLRFVTVGGQEADALTVDQSPQTDASGMAQVTIRHPAKSVAAGDERIEIEATIEGHSAWIGLRLTRNDAVTSLDDVSRKQSKWSDPIWVYQPDATQRTARNNGLVDLQEALNEVVSRHRAVPNYAFIPLDGIFGDEMRDAVSRFRQHFVAVARGADYPYDLTGLNLSQHLRDYLRSEYGFDPDQNATRGWVVDRRLLIGEKWDVAANNLDGLLELKEAVVDRLRSEMVRVAGTYVNEATFWLHRTLHVPYQAAANFVFRITQNAPVNVKTAASGAAANLLDAGGNAVTVRRGELYPSPAVNNAWTQITAGWVPSASGRRVTDDQSVPRNAGTHGRNGVAYSFGCKCRPDEYVGDLTSNPLAPPTDGAGQNLRIAHWDEYENEHKPGRRQNDVAPTVPHATGCDCSGFVQNCITESMFDGVNTRVVPASLMARLRRVASRWTQNEIPAAGFVGAAAYARLVPTPTADANRNWMRGGDVIANANHIVFVSADRPAVVVVGGAVSNTGQTFDVYNEFGGDRYYLANGAQAPVDNTQFTRKAILMPFHWWGAQFNAVNIGKPYIWR